MSNKQTSKSQKAENSGAIDITKELSVSLFDVGAFEMTLSGEGLTKDIQCGFTPSDGVASIFDNRHSALVLTPASSLPADGHLIVVIGNFTTILHKNANGDFVIPLQSVSGNNVSITLNSVMFPTSVTQYQFQVKWMIADSIAESSPTNGITVAEKEVTLTSTYTPAPAIKLVGDKRLYTSSETLSLNVAWADIPEGNELTVTLMRKSDQGEYGSTGWEKEVDITNSTSEVIPVTLGGQSAGSYRLTLTLMDGLVKTSEANYYFIIQ